MTSKIIMFVVLLFFLYSCTKSKKFEKSIAVKDAFFDGVIQVEKVEKLDKYKVSIFNKLNGASDYIYTPYEIFQLETGDVNHDQKIDICIGIIKPTPFDTFFRKRLFLFQIDRDYIRPLWLSSRLVNPLEEFIVSKNTEDCTIMTIEMKNKNRYCINEYRWESFGMAFLKQHFDSLTYSNALELIHNTN